MVDTMLYYKITKKYSHCQCAYLLPFCSSYGFFIIEFVYTLFIVTSFIWVTSLYLSLNIRWQQWASNQLIALNLARDHLEKFLLEKTHKNITFKQDHYNVEIYSQEYHLLDNIPYLSKKKTLLCVINVAVTWSDDKENNHGVILQSYW